MEPGVEKGRSPTSQLNPVGCNAHPDPESADRMPKRLMCGVVVWILVIAQSVNVQAQETASADSLKTYDLSEIVIGGQTRQDDRTERVFRVDLATLARQDVPDVASTLRLLPSASTQTNSRGETLVYIRSAGERQVAVFLDGAPLNIAWDNRIDLSLVPATVLGAMTVERGAVSPGYGTNTSGGALNLQSRSLTSDGQLSEITLQGGTAGSRQIKGLFASKRNANSFLMGATYASRDGLRLPGDIELEFEPKSDTRVNSDREQSNVYMRLDRTGDRGQLGLTFMHARAQKGVAPEGHLDPAMDRVRYWRYPLWRHSMAILNGVAQAKGLSWSGSTWIARFRQDIANYEDVSYARADERQEDTDLSGGLRMIAERERANWRWRLITVGSWAQHSQRELDLAASGSNAQSQEYQSLLHTLGGEVTSASGYPGHWAFGVAWDGMRTFETGLFPSDGGFDAYSLNAEWHRSVGSMTTIKLIAGSKPRFPTMRELFGTALDRFVINPDLKPERTWMAEAGWMVQKSSWQAEVMGFVQRTQDTIDRENIDDAGVRKRQRINLDGSRVVGIEWSGAGEISRAISILGHATWMRPVVTGDSENNRLTEKPEILATIQSRMELRRGVRVDLTGVYTGKAYGLGPDNTLIDLPTSLRINVRLAIQRFFSDSGVFLQMYAGVDNITDDVHIAQLGIPSAGRTARIGLNLSR